MKRSLVRIISLYWKTDFQESTPKNPNANVSARTDVAFWAVGYHSPRVQTSSSHILYKI